MGSWAHGIFANDYALDFVEGLAGECKTEMSPPTCVEDADLTMASVATLKVLVEHCGALPPGREELEALKMNVLRVYAAEIDGLEPDGDFKRDRRRAIDQTFDAFLLLIDKLAKRAN